MRRTSLQPAVVIVWLALAAIVGHAWAEGGPASPPAAASSATAIGTIRDPRVDAVMNGVINATDPGASVIVILRGQVVHAAGYGLANLESRVMLLKEAGQVDYADPVATHLPELARFGKRVTLLQLLHHVSGIPDPTGVYSNAGYDLLGTVVEHVSGQSFDAFMQQRVFEPLGMTGSFSMPNATRFADPHRARGYHRNLSDGSWVVDDSDPLDNLVGAGSVYSSVSDLFFYDQALYTDQLVTQATLAAAFQPTRLGRDRVVKYGFGWYLGTRSGKRYTNHGGLWEGYRSHILRFPDDQCSVFVLANRTDLSPESLAFQIFEIFVPEL